MKMLKKLVIMLVLTGSCAVQAPEPSQEELLHIIAADRLRSNK